MLAPPRPVGKNHCRPNPHRVGGPEDSERACVCRLRIAPGLDASKVLRESVASLGSES